MKTIHAPVLQYIEDICLMFQHEKKVWNIKETKV